MSAVADVPAAAGTASRTRRAPLRESRLACHHLLLLLASLQLLLPPLTAQLLLQRCCEGWAHQLLPECGTWRWAWRAQAAAGPGAAATCCPCPAQTHPGSAHGPSSTSCASAARATRASPGALELELGWQHLGGCCCCQRWWRWLCCHHGCCCRLRLAGAVQAAGAAAGSAAAGSRRCCWRRQLLVSLPPPRRCCALVHAWPGLRWACGGIGSAGGWLHAWRVAPQHNGGVSECVGTSEQTTPTHTHLRRCRSSSWSAASRPKPSREAHSPCSCRAGHQHAVSRLDSLAARLGAQRCARITTVVGCQLCHVQSDTTDSPLDPGLPQTAAH